ncbi:disease resistance-like protein DSC1 [Neltuma alba]|uniref:disease resistance-like protein DSC1 n=1 Tax=Neltuma alba TaxID=207710 RepID=UPI0010A3587E|nr:disease resistance-like protein DSC1 [Prosopis alba]
MDLLDFSKAQEIEWEGICFCESFCNVDPHILSLSMTVALNLVRSKYSKTLHSEGNFRSLRNFDVSFCFSVKEFSLSSKEISDLDLLTSNSKILYSSIGSLSELRRIILGGSRLEIPPINELCCLRSFEELNLSDCRQMNQSPKLHVLFDALFDLQELFIAGCSDFFKVPDIIGTYSSLKYLGLKGSCIDSLPASIKNLSLLQAIYLRNCRRLLSIPQLPPSVMHLDATNCTSLENVFTITTSAPQQEDILSYFFSFVNCLKLDEHSLCNIMDNAYLSLKRAVLDNLEASVFCYPSNRVPKGFRSNQIREASMSMQLSPAVDKYGEKLEGSSTCGYSITELYCDHVFLWYDPQYCIHIVEGVKSKLGQREDVPKVSFEFYVVTYDDDNGERVNHEHLIKECRVHPIYVSEQ